MGGAHDIDGPRVWVIGADRGSRAARRMRRRLTLGAIADAVYSHLRNA